MRSLPIRPLLGLVVALVFLAGCSDDLLTEANDPDGISAPKADFSAHVGGSDGAPRSADRPVLRHPQLLERATSRLKSEDPGRARRRQATARRITERAPSSSAPRAQGNAAPTLGKAAEAPTSVMMSGILLDEPVAMPYARGGDLQTHLFLAFNEYGPDGVTPRILDQWGITQRIMTEYGITRRVLQEYGITRRVMTEYGITRRVMQDYGGLTIELLEAYGITQRIMTDYGVTREQLETELAAAESAIRLRLRVSKAYPGISISFGSALLDALLLELSDDPDVLFAEPDAEIAGGSFYLREGFQESGQMVPWNTARVGGVFTHYHHSRKIHIFILDSGVYDRDLNVVEAKDFTMLFVNRDEETWDDADFADMPVFDPGEAGDPVDRTGHGTHVAGTIGAENNDIGVRGMAPKAKLHSLKVLTDEGRTDVTTVVAAIDYVTDFKQRYPREPVVMNLSLGMDIETTAYNVLDEAVKRATQFGVVVVVSAGNDGADAATYSPAHVAEAITVGAYDQDNRFASFSNFGPVVDLLAPGDLAVSLTHLQSEADASENVLMSGTSMAAPHVTAAAALYLYQNSNATPAEVQSALLGYSRGGIQNAPSGTTSRTVHVAAFAADGNERAFAFSQASWDAAQATLSLSGYGPRLDMVEFYDMGTEAQIASAVVMEDGRFRADLSGLASVPCAVLAVYRGFTFDYEEAVRTTANAPAHCATTPPSVVRAEWKDANSELKVEGVGPAGAMISIADANTAESIATVTAGANGEFRFERRVPGHKPCAVRAVLSNGVSSTSFPVKDASRNCNQAGGPPSDPIPVRAYAAPWNAETQTLTITGEATPGTTVAASSAATGAALSGSFTMDALGIFEMTVRTPSPLPCRVRLESADGSETVVAVTDQASGSAPATCEDALRITSVSWRANQSEVDVEGRGLYGARVEVRNARDGAPLATVHAGGDGTISAKLRGLPIIPCRVEIASGGVTVQRAVVNAPASCDKRITIGSVNWDPAAHNLVVGGQATGGAVITLYNADNGVALETTETDGVGSFGFTLRLLPDALPPCRIRAVGPSGEAAEHALGGSCDPTFTYTERPADETEQNPYSYIVMQSAQWRGEKLIARGRGYVGMTVTLRNASTGEVLGTDEVNSQQRWSMNIQDLGTPPCTVEAVLDGRSATLAVSGAPSNCRN